MFPKKMPEWFRKEDNMHNNYFLFLFLLVVYDYKHVIYIIHFPKMFIFLLIVFWLKKTNKLLFLLYEFPTSPANNIFCYFFEFQSPGFAVLIDRRNETWQEAQSVFEKIVTIFPAKIKEVFLVYQYTSGERKI